ncbi:MAG TPA: SMP-30/gluconolactonase/LRE family protein [Nocardioidaceae bacterium]|nr:SMP-30/gluconolactonase/LRE family protein [Nocardioidaceae bacterium]
MTRTTSTETGASAFTVHDPAFLDVLGEHPRLAHVTAVDAHEGPVYAADEDALYFTTLPRPGLPPVGEPQVAIKRLALDGESFPVGADAVTTLRADSNAANGMALDREGRLVVCEQGSLVDHARISLVARETGQAETVVDGWRGLRLNSPNDVVVARDGSIWFTDPSYGHLQGFRPEPVVGDHVYRYDPVTRSIAVVADSFVKPNGLAFSPDESILYVTDSGANQEPGSYHVGLPHHVVAFDVLDGRHLSAPRLFEVTTPGFPDGIKVDVRGRVYASSFTGVQVFDPAGDLIGEIAVPGAVNFCFGGPGHNVLFITTDTDIWAAVLATQGT